MLAGGRTPPLTGRPGMRPGVRLSSRRRDTSRDRRPRAPARDRGWRGQRRSRRVESDAARNQEIHGSESVDDRRAMPPRVQATSEVSRDHEQGRPVTTISVRHHPSLFLRGEADTGGDEARAPGGPGRRSGDTREALRPSWDVTQAVRGCGNVIAVKARLQPADACHREGIRVCAAMEDIRVCAAKGISESVRLRGISESVRLWSISESVRLRGTDEETHKTAVPSPWASSRLRLGQSQALAGRWPWL